MSSQSGEFKIGDSVMVVGTEHDGELATIIGAAPGLDGRYIVVFENGKQAVLNAENLSHRR
ncbi:MAG: hypothetical protein DMG13_21260 [Acidobacteria bacterium]|nr:MAG: hypothetical protein DMG13_21260 [Acidobacteriota bacterium]